MPLIKERKMSKILKVQEIISTHEITCPHCKNPIYILHNKNNEVPLSNGGKTWLQDGDNLCCAIPPSKEKEKMLKKRTLFSELLIGTCAQCKKNYFVIELIRCSHEFSQNSTFEEKFILDDDGDEFKLHNYSVLGYKDALIGAEYIIHDFVGTKYCIDEFKDVGNDITLTKDFIVLNVLDDDAKTEHGMSACQGESNVWQIGANFLMANYDYILENKE